MQENVFVYNLIAETLHETEFEPDLDEDEKEIEPNELRRLFQVLMLPPPLMVDKFAASREADED